jgi:hypothetical protein
MRKSILTDSRRKIKPTLQEPRYGIQLSDLEKDQIKFMSVDQRRVAILQRIEAAYKGQAQAMADVSGGIMQAEAEFGSLVKTLGEGLLTALNPVIIALTTVISFLANAGLKAHGQGHHAILPPSSTATKRPFP